MSKVTKMAAAELEGLARDRQRIKALKLELEGINTKLYSPRGATLDAVPAHGGGNKQEDKIVKAIENPKRKALQKEIKELTARVAAIEETVEQLPMIERRVVQAYYMGGAYTMARLMQETNYSESHLIRKKLDALRHYAYMRGIDDQDDAKKYAKNVIKKTGQTVV